MCLRSSLLLCVILLNVFTRQTCGDIILGAPQKLSAPVNTNRIDESPVILPGGNAMLFSSNRSGTSRLWQVTRSQADAPWGSAAQIGEIENTVRGSSVSSDGLELYFAEGWRPFDPSSIWVSTRESVDAPWGEPEKLGRAINSSGGADGPVISTDRLSLYFSSNRPGGYGGTDLYVSRRTNVNDDWGEPKNLGPEVNSDRHDWANGLAQDGRTLFFTSFRSGWLGVHVATRDNTDEAFNNPLPFPAPVNVPPDAWSLRPSPDGTSLLYTTGHNNNVDIWEVPLIPFDSVTIAGKDGVYRQDFDVALGSNDTEVAMPSGWTATDGDTFFHLSATNTPFPTTRVTGSEPHVFNAGKNDDRSLAVYVPKRSKAPTLQLLAKTSESDANAVRLRFDIEAWDNLRDRSEPGEAAFDVTIDIDRGNGFQSLADLGKVTTGETLRLPDDELLDGNSDANRMSHDSGMFVGSIPQDAELRVRWKADVDGQTEGWLFGLDNVELSMHFLGDFDDDGILGSGDIDLLSSAVLQNTQSAVFDLTGDGSITNLDRKYWIEELAATLPGDADLDGQVAFADFLALSDHFGASGGWAQGDFDGNGEINFPDFLALSANFGQTTVAAAAVPEPSSAVLLMLGLVAGKRRRRS